MSVTPRTRCSWPNTELDIAYHDTEWGVPVHDDRMFFEFLTLEGTQAGLSWSMILKKWEGYRAAFAGFDPAVVARFSDADVDDWRDAVSDSRIVVARSRIMHRTRSFTNHVS